MTLQNVNEVNREALSPWAASSVCDSTKHNGLITICIGLTPLYRICPRLEVGRRTGAMSGEVFYGRTDGRTADGGEKET